MVFLGLKLLKLQQNEWNALPVMFDLRTDKLRNLQMRTDKLRNVQMRTDKLRNFRFDQLRNRCKLNCCSRRKLGSALGTALGLALGRGHS